MWWARLWVSAGRPDQAAGALTSDDGKDDRLSLRWAGLSRPVRQPSPPRLGVRDGWLHDRRRVGPGLVLLVRTVLTVVGAAAGRLGVSVASVVAVGGAIVQLVSSVIVAVVGVLGGWSPHDSHRNGLAAALPILAGTAPVLGVVTATGAVPLTGIAVVSVAGIVISGAMTATWLAGRRALDQLRDPMAAVVGRPRRMRIWSGSARSCLVRVNPSSLVRPEMIGYAIERTSVERATNARCHRTGRHGAFLAKSASAGRGYGEHSDRPGGRTPYRRPSPRQLTACAAAISAASRSSTSPRLAQRWRSWDC
jgi:hypothetical protein